VKHDLNSWSSTSTLNATRRHHINNRLVIETDWKRSEVIRIKGTKNLVTAMSESTNGAMNSAVPSDSKDFSNALPIHKIGPFEEESLTNAASYTSGT
jgi:hypothetical protein